MDKKFEFRDKKSGFSEHNQKMRSRLNGLFGPLAAEQKVALAKEINARAIYLQNKYSTCKQYQVFHIVSGSSLFEDSGKYLEKDFPGKDSVEAFIDSLVAKYSI